MSSDVQDKVQCARAALHKLLPVWRSELSPKVKEAVCASKVLLVLLYRVESGLYSAKDLTSMRVFVARCARRIDRWSSSGRSSARKAIKLPLVDEIVAWHQLKFAASILQDTPCQAA
jgi:hypothetical protein